MPTFLENDNLQIQNMDLLRIMLSVNLYPHQLLLNVTINSFHPERVLLMRLLGLSVNG